MEDIIWNKEGPREVVGGGVYTWSATFDGNPTIASAAIKIYQGTTDTLLTLISTYTCTVTGSTITLPTITIPASPAREYVVCITPVIDGNTDPRKILIKASKPTDGM